MNFIGNRNFRAGPQTSLEGFICPQNSDKQQKIKVFGRSGEGENQLGKILTKIREKEKGSPKEKRRVLPPHRPSENLDFLLFITVLRAYKAL